MRFRCPHCGTLSVVRTSETMSATLTWLYVQCRNIECGHTWRVDAEASLTISPSAIPHPEVKLPLKRRKRRSVQLPLSPSVSRIAPSKRLQTDLIGQRRRQNTWIGDLFDNLDAERGPPDGAPDLTGP